MIDDCDGTTEVVADGIDQDCDQNDLCYADADLDGYGSSKTLAAPSCDSLHRPSNGNDDVPTVTNGVSVTRGSRTHG